MLAYNSKNLNLLASFESKAPVLCIYQLNNEYFLLGQSKSIVQIVKIIDLNIVLEVQIGGPGKDIY